MEIKDVIAKAKKYGEIQSLKRVTTNTLPYKMEIAMQAVQAIGKSIVPHFVLDNENRWVFEQLVKWVHGDVSMQAQNPITGELVTGRLTKGIYLAGNTGSGKSLALQIISIYRNIDNVQILINGEQRNLNFYPIRVDEICDAYISKGDLAKYKKMPIMCVQDFGSEPLESQYMGNRINVMQQVIEARGDRNDLITLFSSNLPISLPKLQERYGSRVASRLTEMCNYIVLKGADRRTIKY